ncbi:C-C motif chemokine 4-like [Pituophis catenifer annectens]|uniref:C-C motif chemokine 4-like n=1 Tax=Pituophis catenifer annectens TaxID=94852 RepID=UPI0039910DA3
MRASTQTAASLALLVLVLSSSILASYPPISCCFKYSKKKIPRNLVIDFYETNGQCSQPAVVFITRKKLQMCTNPSEQWVQDYMKYLKMNRTVNATATY